MVDATSLGARLASREVSCTEVAREFLSSIEPDDFNAWAAVDPEWLLSQAVALDRIDEESRLALPLFGLPVGVKDNFDTARLPTEYGSPIYSGWRPRRDSAVVARLRAAGAMIAGKTKLAEFAWMTPCDTLNPVNPVCTPGGSSSGSAAAVAAGAVWIATGTQTAGSINRPASYCGVLGFKPTFGKLSRRGVKLLSPSLDTVGLLARSVQDLELATAVLDPSSCTASYGARRDSPPRLAFARTSLWDRVEANARESIQASLELMRQALPIEDLALPERFTDLVDAQLTIQLYESARSLRPEFDASRDQLSNQLQDALVEGAAIAPAEYRRAKETANTLRNPVAQLLERFDGVLTPSATGVPPRGLSFTGDPLFCRAWTLIGAPALSLPLAWIEERLPVGVQLVGAPGDDRRLLRAGSWITNSFPTYSRY